MSLNYVTLVLDLYDGQGNPVITGKAAFTQSVTLTDPGVEWIPPVPIPAVFHAGGLPQVKLLATDSTSAVPGGWTWAVAFTGVPGSPAAFSFFLPFSGGATQYLSALAQVPAVAPAQAYLPLPTGPATAGLVPIATGAGEASAWGSPGAASLPLTTLGDTLYEDATPTPVRLPGNITSTKKYLTQTGTGSVSAVPGWNTIAAADLPTLDLIPAPAAAVSLNSKKITSLLNGSAAQDAAAFGQIPVADATAADIQPEGTQTAGATGKWADGGHIHPAVSWLPSDNGLLLAQGGDPALLTSTAITIAGTLYLIKLPVWYARTVSNLVVQVSAAAVGTSTTTFCGLYSSAGTLLTGSSDVSTPLKSGGTATLPVTTPQALTAGTFVWAALLTNLGTTQPTLFKGGSITNNVPNSGLAATAYRWAINGTGLSALPGSITPASNVSTNALTFWCGAT